MLSYKPIEMVLFYKIKFNKIYQNTDQQKWGDYHCFVCDKEAIFLNFYSFGCKIHSTLWADAEVSCF